MPTRETVTVMAVGDVGPVYDPVPDYLRTAGAVLEQADLRLANCERVYAKVDSDAVNSASITIPIPSASPKSAYIFKECGFDVVGLAGNHAMDFGPDGLRQTISALHDRGIATVGAGMNIEEARRPAIVERKGVRIAVLAYGSIMMPGAPMMKGQAATAETPGIAPLRAHAFYEPTWDWEPGSPGVARSLPVPDDLDAVVGDIRSARQSADVVVVMLHWGVHLIPHVIAEYQPVVAKAVFRAGADVIFGHHSGVPKAAVRYPEGACFYSLGYFLMSVPARTPEQQATRGLDRFGIELDPDYPRLPFGRDAQRTMIGRADLTAGGLVEASFYPGWIDRELRPMMLEPGDERFDDMVGFMAQAAWGFHQDFRIDGGRIILDDSTAT